MQSSPLRIDTLLWQHKTSGVAYNEPVIVGGLVYFAGRDRRLEILDAVTGKRVLRKRFDGPVTGVVPGDSLFAFATDQDERQLFLYEYNPVRELRSIDIPTSSAPPRRLSDGSLLIAGIRGELVRLDPSGETMWHVKARGAITAAPTVVDSVILLAAGKTVTARRLDDGSTEWTYEASGAVRAAPAVDDRAYFGSTDSLLYAVSLEDGAMQWFFATNGQILTSPTVGPDRVYLAVNDRNIYALDKTNGHLIWSYDTGAPANKEPTLAGDILVVATQTGELLLLDATTGNKIREFELSAPAATAPVVANGRIYVSDTRRRLYCFGPANPIPVAADPASD